jgi:hypothetical protein
VFLTGKKVRKALVRAGQESLLDDLAEEMCQVQYGALDGCGHLPVLARAAGIVAQQLGLDFADSYEAVRGALQEAAHTYARDEEPIRFGRLVYDLDSRLNDYYDGEDQAALELRRHLQRQRFREEAGRRMGLDPGFDPDRDEGDEDADVPPPWLDDEDEQDEDVPEPGPGRMPLLDHLPTARPTVDGVRGRRLESEGGRARRATGKGKEPQLDGFDAAQLAEQQRQVAAEEAARQRARYQQQRTLTAADYERSRRCPQMYGRLDVPQYAPRRRRR